MVRDTTTLPRFVVVDGLGVVVGVAVVEVLVVSFVLKGYRCIGLAVDDIITGLVG